MPLDCLCHVVLHASDVIADMFVYRQGQNCIQLFIYLIRISIRFHNVKTILPKNLGLQQLQIKMGKKY